MTYENISKDTHGFATNNDLDTGNVIEQTDHKEPDFPGENSGHFWRQNTGFCHLPMDVFSQIVGILSQPPQGVRSFLGTPFSWEKNHPVTRKHHKTTQIIRPILYTQQERWLFGYCIDPINGTNR